MSSSFISGRYKLIEVVGTGGMSVVYRAWDTKYDCEVAIKVLRREYIEDEEFIRRFNHEAQAASQMSHPNIVNMYDVGRDGDVRYIVMEYIKGKTLKEIIRAEGKLPPQKAVQIALRILAAVDHAHKNHIVHRDIKPQNILVDEDGVIKVADFGIARLTTSSTLTINDGNVLGSVHYFSPEQANGKTADEKSDLYSVGVVLYEMLTGRVPFDAESPVIVALKHVRETPKSTRQIDLSISRGLDEVIMKSLEKDSGRRYQTAAEMAQDLKKAIRMPGGGFVKYPEGRIPAMRFPEGRTEERKKKLGAVLGILLVMLLAVALLAMTVGKGFVQGLIEQFSVPNFVMMSEADAKTKLEEYGLSYSVDSRHDETVPKGLIAEQQPEAGSLTWPGSGVHIVVSEGKGQVMVPRLLELTRGEAIVELEKSELQPGVVVFVASSDVAAGTVIDQEPKPNEWVAAESEVKLFISATSVPVPDLIGMQLQDAGQRLRNLGLAQGTVTERYEPDAESGAVLEQSLEADSVVLSGTPVALTVAQAVPEDYRQQAKFKVTIAEDDSLVQVIMRSEQGDEQQVYSERINAGKRTINLDLNHLEAGTCDLLLYVNEELVEQKQVEFGAEEE